MKIIILFSVIHFAFAQNPCVPRNLGDNSIVCVCNSTYCDTVPQPSPLPAGQFLVYTSNQAGLRFSLETGNFQNLPSNNSVIAISRNITYQRILGFGGAFTDSTGININSLPQGAGQNLINSYFSSEGLEYSLGRIPIGGTDFSTHGYSYDDGEEDPDLSNFALAPEDYEYKIPIILQALELTNNNLNLFGSLWTAPTWMKTNGQYAGILGFLKSEHYQTYADYHLKFLESYDREGIKLWGLTTGNEPLNVYFGEALILFQLNNVGWNPTDLNNYIINNLGPTIQNSNYSDIKILTLDDQRYGLPWFPEKAMNGEAYDYVDGIALHWYADTLFPVSLLDLTHDKFPDKFLLYTEACNGFGLPPEVTLGRWDRGETYAESIIENLNHWSTGWVDWNMALDTEGGPTYINNNVESPIIVNATAQEFYKNPSFYNLGHIAKFVPRDSVRINLSILDISDVDTIAFERPDGAITLVILNKRTEDIVVTVLDPERGTAQLDITQKSITTVVYW